ncbi:MAG TPA: carboxypeptidase regulatory-like domain-containing protein, partial [Acidobacteriaceae bacterium]
MKLPTPKPCLSLLTAAALLLLSPAGRAHAQAIAATTPGAASLHGQVADPTGAVIPGATVSLTTADGHTVARATSEPDGSYEIRGLAPGTYIVLVVAPGFAPLDSKAITLTGPQARLFDATLKIQTAQQTVQVTEGVPTVSVDPDANASSVTIKGADLDALSDDPDELSNELTALAGPAAGPSGGQVFIDGFTAGQLQPKSAIREIRVNQNPYGAQFDKLGFGRVEILTKPGSDKYHGQFFVQGNMRQFNTGNPFTQNIPDYDSYQYNGTVSGPINKAASFFFSAERRNIQDASIISAYRLLGETNGDFAAGNYGNSADYAISHYNNGLNTPTTRTNISPRLDLQLGQKNTLVARYQFERSTAQNQGVGQFSLQSQAYNSSATENTIQISDTTVLSPKVINEAHLQLIFERSNQGTASTAPQVQVQGNETFGGNSEQTISDHTDRYELSDFTEVALKSHALNIGGRLRATREANAANSSFNGIYTFGARPCPSTAVCNGSAQISAIQAYATTLQGLANGESFAQIQAAGGGPSQLVFVTGNPKAAIDVIDGALFYQDDWKARPNLTLSYGLRWETQNVIHDHSDFAPRLAVAYGIMRGGKPTKDVLRAGFGYFYDRFGASPVLQSTRDNGVVQQERVIQNPSCYLPGGLPNTATLLTECAAGDTNTVSGSSQGSSLAPARYQIAPNLHAPLNIQESVGLDHQLNKTSTMSVTYIHSHGVHALDTINANAPYSPTYDAALGNVYQYYSEAVYNQNQLFLNVNARFTKNLSLFGYYGLGFANSDTGGTNSNPSNSLNLKADYGRASFDVRNRLFLIGTYSAPHYFRFSPFIVAQSGAPFNITLSQDQNGDSFFNDRPSFGTPGAAAVEQTSYGSFDTTPPPGATPIPINYGHGPALFTFNLRTSKTFGFGARTGPPADSASGGPPGGGPPRGGPGGGGPGRGGPGGGGPGGGAGNTGKRYNLTLNAQALNLFNVINLAPPTGTIDSPNFGRSNALAGQIFSSGSAARRVFVQATFTF